MRINTSSPGAVGATALLPALLKLIDVIEEENAVLQEHKVLFHAEFTDRKNQGLKELMAAQRLENPRQAAEACKEMLERLSSALRTNASLLKIHISAVGEMSDIIISGLRDAESDGTYSRNRQRHG